MPAEQLLPRRAFLDSFSLYPFGDEHHIKSGDKF
jgi:hypothetical protein